MSGFSAWTFTGAAGLAYRQGLVAILLYIGNASTFLLGYYLFAARWRRARIGTVMEYLVDRYDERTRQAFSWTTIFFQLFTGAAMLYGLALFVAPACGFSLPWAIVGSGVVILAYCVIGGLWAVVITDFLQAAILMPFTIVMLFAALAKVGGVSGPRRGPAARDDVAGAAARVRVGLRALLDRDGQLWLQHRGDGAALLQRRGRAGLAQDRAALLRPLPARAPSSGSCRRSRCGSCTPTSSRSGRASATRTSRRTRSPRSRCCRPGSSASCSPRC
jgi:hypothetical protein